MNKGVMLLREFRYKNATVKIAGEVNLDKIEKATIIFLKNLQRRKNNGDNNKARAIAK